MKEYKYLFVVLVYRNTEVLKDFFISNCLEDSKVIVVESYFDSSTSNDCKTIANFYNADYISIENKGYGYGNNKGIEYAIKNYKFKFLIISNSDIQIKSCFNLDKYLDRDIVIAPETKLLTGKHQNPNIVTENRCYYKLLKLGYNLNIPLFTLFAHIISRVQRELFLFKHNIFKKEQYRVFSAHGSFIVFTEKSLYKLHPLFCEEMFLYNEELFIAYKCKRKSIPIVYCPSLKVLHLEGGSTFDKKSTFSRNKQSFGILDKILNDN